MKRKLIRTKDGSHTFYVGDLNEHYHSVHGAIQESRHVFIEEGFKQKMYVESLNILEVGFGTGLNALLTMLANTNRADINYTGIEAFPLTLKEAEGLNYTDQLGVPHMRPVFKQMHHCNWGNPVPVYSNFVLTKLRMELKDFNCKKPRFDLVYFDAFAPNIQPEMWTEDVFTRLYQCMRKGAVLVTYCAKGSVKRAMKAAGFEIENLAGPPGKREMTRAVKQ